MQTFKNTSIQLTQRCRNLINKDCFALLEACSRSNIKDFNFQNLLKDDSNSQVTYSKTLELFLDICK